MAQQTINRGAVAGDGTGESLFDAFGKVNSNFTECYGKQDALVSGINIKTINNTSLLGSGDIAISGGSSTLTISNKTGAYTVVAGDNGTVINCTSGTFTVALDAAATLGSGFNCWIWNTSSTATDVVTIDPNGAETIDGATVRYLQRGEGCQIICDGTNWHTGDKKTMRGYAENMNTFTGGSYARATGASALALGYRAIASGDNSLAISTAQATSSNAYSIAIGNATASGAGATAIQGYASQSTASSSYSSAIGLNSAGAGSQAVTGAGAMALGGSYASGADSFAAAIGNNTNSYGAISSNSVAIGYQAKATQYNSIAIGAWGCVSSGGYSVSLGYGYAIGSGSIAIGANNVATSSGTDSIAIGGSCESIVSRAVSIGNSAKSSQLGKYSFASGAYAVAGDAQTGTLVLRRATTDATASTLGSDGNTGSAINQVILPNNSAYAFDGIIVARRQAAGGTESAAWKVEGLIRREANAASTTLVASTVTAISNAPGWTLALSADTTNGGLAVTFTGAAATNIRTVATIRSSEVTYA